MLRISLFTRVLLSIVGSGSVFACEVEAPSDGYDRLGGDFSSFVVDGGAQECAERCCSTSGCLAYVFAIAQRAFGGCKAGDACCFLKDQDVEPTLSSHPNITTAALKRSCNTDLDCELSGQCIKGVCICDPGWSGEHCSNLTFIPNEPGHYAYRHRAPDNQSFWNSWGSSQPIKDSTGKYHVLATRVLNGCHVVPYYTFNEDLVHVVSDTLLGPYEFQNVAVNTTVINPTVLVAPNGTLVLFYSGEPLPAHFHKNCSGAEEAHFYEPPGPPGYRKIGCELSIATSDSWERPFDVKLANFTPRGAEHLFCHTNPSAWIFPNGTTLLYFRTADNHGRNEQIWMATAPHYLGPYTLYGDKPLFDENCEDPFVFRNSRGHFIMVLHDGVGRPDEGSKAFSYDGLTWHFSSERHHVYTNMINYTDGSQIQYHRREEPKIYVEDGQMLAMFNAVDDRHESNVQTTYVMSQGIGAQLKQRDLSPLVI